MRSAVVVKKQGLFGLPEDGGGTVGLIFCVSITANITARNESRVS